MTKQPFTPDGVQLKQQELYALSDTALLAEAKNMTLDFKAWLEANFTFLADQKNYLDRATPMVLTYWAGAISSTIITRQRIDIPKPKKYDPPRRTKELTLEIEGSWGFTPLPDGSTTFQGNQKVIIDYRIIDLP